MAQEILDRASIAERRPRMTYEEWVAWDAAFEGKSEWVDGEVIVFKPSTIRHAAMRGFLFILLSQYAQPLGLVLGAQVEMRLATAARVPDLLFIKNEHLDRLTTDRLLGPADLVVEFISDDSIWRDRTDKLADYAAAGVPESWLFDARTGHTDARFYRLVDGAYQEMPLDAEDRYWSAALPGFWLRPEWLSQDRPPNALAILAEIAPDAVRAALAVLDPTGNAGPDAGEAGTNGATR